MKIGTPGRAADSIQKETFRRIQEEFPGAIPTRINGRILIESSLAELLTDSLGKFSE